MQYLFSSTETGIEELRFVLENDTSSQYNTIWARAPFARMRLRSVALKLEVNPSHAFGDWL